MNTIAILCDIVGNLRPLSRLLRLTHIFVFTSQTSIVDAILTLPTIFLASLASVKCSRLLYTIARFRKRLFAFAKWRKLYWTTVPSFGSFFGIFRPLSSTTSAGARPLSTRLISILTYHCSVYRNRSLDAFAEMPTLMNAILILCHIVGNLRPLSTNFGLHLFSYFTNVLYRRRFFDFAKLRTL